MKDGTFTLHDYTGDEKKNFAGKFYTPVKLRLTPRQNSKHF